MEIELANIIDQDFKKDLQVKLALCSLVKISNADSKLQA